MPVNQPLVDQWLTSTERSLFLRQSAYEQAHSCQLAGQLLLRHPDAARPLVAAALLHDVGKSALRLRPWHRVAFVLLTQRGQQTLDRWQVETSPAWARPLVLLRHHAAWGSALAAQQGVDSRVCTLIARHHEPVGDPELRWLQEIDGG